MIDNNDIKELMMRNEALILENEALRLHIEDLKNGFEGSCVACEPVALKNRELLKERDEARRQVCFLSVFDPEVPHLNYDFSEREYARKCGWDCFKDYK